MRVPDRYQYKIRDFSVPVVLLLLAEQGSSTITPHSHRLVFLTKSCFREVFLKKSFKGVFLEILGSTLGQKPRAAQGTFWACFCA